MRCRHGSREAHGAGLHPEKTPGGDVILDNCNLHEKKIRINDSWGSGALRTDLRRHFYRSHHVTNSTHATGPVE